MLALQLLSARLTNESGGHVWLWSAGLRIGLSVVRLDDPDITVKGR